MISDVITEIQKSLAKLWAQQAMQAVMGSSGGNWFSSIFGGASTFSGIEGYQGGSDVFDLGGNKASGGSVQAGLAYGYNELGKEVFVPSVNGYVLNHEQTRSAMSYGGGPSIVMNIHTNDATSFRKSRGQILAELKTGLAGAGRYS